MLPGGSGVTTEEGGVEIEISLPFIFRRGHFFALQGSAAGSEGQEVV